MKKKIKIKINAPIVIGFVCLCFFATALEYMTKGWANRVLFSTYRSSFTSPMTYIRMLTHTLGHVNWNHFLGNMTYILLLGPMLEEKYSSKILLEVMVITAVFTAFLNQLFFPNISLCGASGIVFAFIILSSFTTFKEGEIPLTFILVFVFFIGQQILQGVFVVDQISNMGHIIGGVIGGICGYYLNKNARQA